MQPVRWYVNRLRAMSVPEVWARGRRQARFALERLGGLRADRPPSPSECPPRPKFSWPLPAGGDVGGSLAWAERVASGSFEFFGERFEMPQGPAWNADPKTGTRAPLVFGKSLDYRDSNIVGDIKYLWELNRHLELVPLAQAYALTGDRKYLVSLRALVWSWIRQCPYPLGPNWCSSLELAIRLINWQFAYVISGGADSPLFEGPEGQRFAEDWLGSIYQHVHFIMGHLSSHSSANNHLIGELAGVCVAASTWPGWPEMQAWGRRAAAGLSEQVEQQTHSDGVNKEQAVWYQQFVMYFLLVAGLVGQRAAAPFADSYWQALRRMTAFLDALLDVRGNLPMIGDADDGIVFALVAKDEFDPFCALLPIGAMLFDEPRWRHRFPAHDTTAQWLCADLRAVLPPEQKQAERREFAVGGYYVLGSRLGEPEEIRIVVDAGPLGFLSIAAHGHADCLAFTLSVAGQEFLIDPGTYCYHTQRTWRDYFRSTAAHNTVRVDGIDQSQIAGPFLWAEKAEVSQCEFQTTASMDRFKASHDGYRRLADSLIHAREIRFDKQARTIDVIDEIRCDGKHRIERFWHFSEACEVELSGQQLVARNAEMSLLLATAEPEALGCLRRESTAPLGGWISRRFGHKVPTTTAMFAIDVRGSSVLRTRIELLA